VNLLAHIFGLDNDFGLLAITGSLLRKHNCHVHRCWRLGRHQVEGTAHVVCRKHHPDGHLTAGDVIGGAGR